MKIDKKTIVPIVAGIVLVVCIIWMAAQVKVDVELSRLSPKVKKVELLAIQSIDETYTTSTPVDTYLADGSSFPYVWVTIEAGDLTNVTTTTVTIQESDSATFASGVTTASGGAATTLAADTSYKLEITRAKRYLRALMTTTGSSSAIEIFVGAILWDVQLPFPIL